jgi:hypothetical protein
MEKSKSSQKTKSPLSTVIVMNNSSLPRKGNKMKSWLVQVYWMWPWGWSPSDWCVCKSLGDLVGCINDLRSKNMMWSVVECI